MDATETITPNSPPAVPPRRVIRWVPAAVVGLALGLGLVGLSGVHLIAALLELDARSVLWQAHAGAELPAEQLAAAAADLAAASAWVPDGGRDGERGYLLFQQAMATPPGSQRQRLLSAAAEATAAGLAHAPSQPNAWARLAHLRALAGNSAAAAQALRLSLLTGPVAPALMASRLTLGLALLPALAPETEALLRRQVRLTWVIEPDAVSALARQRSGGLFIGNALADLSAEEQSQFLRRFGTR